MAEIKSTLELAMERTKKISISRKEREEIKQKEILQKVTGLFHRYAEGHLPWTEILKEIERMKENTKGMVREVLLSQLIDSLSLNDEHERLLKAIESLKHRDVDVVKQKLDRLLIQYREEEEKSKQEMRTQLLETLKGEGIYGKAVEPNIEMSPLWEKENEKLKHRYDVELKEIKEQLRFL